MKWELSSINHYLENQDYVDTAIIPVIQICLGQETKDSIRKATWLTGVSHKVEEQLAGRVLLFPSYSVSAANELNAILAELRTYALYLQRHQFKHIVFLHTSFLPDVSEQEEEVYDLVNLSLEIPDTEQFEEENFSQQVQELVRALIKLWQK